MDYVDAAAGHLLPARDRLGRPDRAAVRGAGPAGQGRQGPVPGDRQGAHRRRVRGLREDHRRTRRPTTRSGSTSSARTRPTSSRRRRSPSTSTRRRGRSGLARTRTRRCRRSSARPRWRSTGGRSTSDGGTLATGPAHGGRDDGHGSQRRRRDEPPRRLGRARPTPTSSRCTARSRSRAPSTSGCGSSTGPGRIPFVISGQGHEGAQVGLAWPLAQGHDWIAPYYRSIATCLAFGMTRARPDARAVREGQRPVVGRPPDARPLRLAPSTTSSRSRRRSRRRSCTRSGIALAAKIRKHRTRSRSRSWARAARTRATSTRRSTSRRSTSCRSCSSSRTTATRSASRPRRSSSVKDVADPGVGLRDPGRHRGRDRRARLLRGRRARRSSGRASGGGPDAHRGQGDPPHRALARTTSRRSTAPSRRPAEGRRAKTRCRSSGPALRDGGVLTDEIEAALATEIAAHRRGRDRLRGGPSRTPTRSTALDWVYAEHWPGEPPPPWHPAPAGRRTAGRRRALMADPDVHRGDPRRHGRGDAARRRRSSSWARTSARRAACSSPPTACGPSSATTGSSTRR